MKWTESPIVYKFDGKHSDAQQLHIKAAFDYWEERTCLIFKEIPQQETYNDPHILVTRENTGCHSYVGRVGRRRSSGRTSNIPQQV